LLFTPKDVFWNWSEKYDLIVREVFEVVSFHPEGIAIEEINGKLGQLASQHKIQEVLSNSSILLKYFFVIEQNGRYYPFFSNCITQDALTKAREQLRTMASQRAELLRMEYYMPKYHVDVILKLLKGAKNLTTILRTWANKEIRFDDVKITRTLLKTRKTGLSKYMISRMKERFEALENDGLLQLVQGKYFITDLAKELISNNNMVLSLGYSDILLFEEKIVKKGHEYWDIKEYLDYMLRLGLLKEVAQHPDRLFYITSKGKDVLRRGFDPRILFER
jgi:predicted transcriptional regulator